VNHIAEMHEQWDTCSLTQLRHRKVPFKNAGLSCYDAVRGHWFVTPVRTRSRCVLTASCRNDIVMVFVEKKSFYGVPNCRGKSTAPQVSR